MTRLPNAEIDAIEANFDLALPGLYRKLLVEIGYGPLGEAAEIYHPVSIRELYTPFFEDPELLFHPYFPFGCQNDKQEIWVIDASRECAASISHEISPEDWPEEEWLSYDVWIETYLEPALTAAL